MTNIYLALGANIGDKKEMLKKAIIKLEENNIKITQKSSLYETEPWGEKNQDWYLNQVVCGVTNLSPEELLRTVKNIENELGRQKRKHWMEREIDIDILFYDDQVIETENLTIPHARLPQRNFVLTPLKEIAPDLIHPVLNKTIKVLEAECRDTSEIKKCNF